MHAHVLKEIYRTYFLIEIIPIGSYIFSFYEIHLLNYVVSFKVARYFLNSFR